MSVIAAHFDGKVLVPDEPVSLPQGKQLKVSIEIVKEKPPKAKRRPSFKIGMNPVRSGIADASVNHDKYIYTGL